MADIINAGYKGAFGRKSALVWLLAVNATVFVVLRAVASAGVICGHDEWAPQALAHLSLAPRNAMTLTDWWTWLTYMVTQYDASHLIFNMMWLAWFGMFMQCAAGNRGVVATYLAGGVMGGVAFILWSTSADGSSTEGLVGASAAVMAVAVAVTITEPDKPVGIPLLGEWRLKWVSLVMIAVCVVCFSGYNPGSDAAHAGGALAGVVCGLYARRRRIGRSRVSVSPCVPPSTVDLSLTDSRLLDALLDKIRRSGYDSLSPDERASLFNLSQRIEKR